MSRALLTRLLAPAALILSLAAVPSAPAATGPNGNSSVKPASSVDAGVNADLTDDTSADDPSGDSSVDVCDTSGDNADDSSADDTSSDDSGASVRARGASAPVKPADTPAANDTTPDDTTDDSGDDPNAGDNGSVDCGETLDALSATVKLRLADILRAGVDGGTLRITGPATVREELVLDAGGATAARRAAHGKVVGASVQTVRAAGRVHLVVKLSTAGRHALRRNHGRPRLSLRITVRPTQGAAKVRTRRVVLSRA